jgi:hypothetical protein
MKLPSAFSTSSPFEGPLTGVVFTVSVSPSISESLSNRSSIPTDAVYGIPSTAV